MAAGVDGSSLKVVGNPARTPPARIEAASSGAPPYESRVVKCPVSA
jgi:hypothetical protein